MLTGILIYFMLKFNLPYLTWGLLITLTLDVLLLFEFYDRMATKSIEKEKLKEEGENGKREF